MWCTIHTLRKSANLYFADVDCGLDVDLVWTSWCSDTGKRYVGSVDACNLRFELYAESFVFVVGDSDWNDLSLGVRQSDLYCSCTQTQQRHFVHHNAITASVCPSVRPSVTCWYCVKTAQPIVKLSSLLGSPGP